MRLLKFFIPIGLFFGYLVLLFYPYFFSKINDHDSLGFSSVIEEKQSPLHQIFSNKRILETPDKHLLQGEKLKGVVIASENNFGIVMLKFIKFGKTSDRVIFRIRKTGDTKWYYKQSYRADQMQSNQYFTFGFPPIVDAKNNQYEFEIESVAGTYKNSIGMSPQQKNPKTAYVYKFEKNDLKDPSLMSSFIGKKVLYSLHHVTFFSQWKILIGFISFYLLFLFFMYTKQGKELIKLIVQRKRIERKKIKSIFHKEIKGVILFKKNIIAMYRKYSLQMKKTIVYKRFFNTDLKKRIGISFIIFLFAFFYRYAAALTDPSLLFYATLGGGGDYDQFMRASTCALQLCSPIIHQNLLIESFILGSFYHLFGFIGGLKLYSFLMIIVSSLVAALPYLLLSRKRLLSLGGILGSLFLATNDFLTQVALNYPPDNGSTFLFSLFFIVYLLTMQYATVRWLIAFGLMGFLDGMFKAMFLLNDITALALFVPVFFYEKTKKASLPLRKQIQVLFQQKNRKIFFLSLLPLLIFVVLYSAWEYFVHVKYIAPYFLGGLLESFGSNHAYAKAITGNAMPASASFSETFSKGNILLQFYYYAGSIIISLKREIVAAGFTAFLLAPIFLGVLYTTFSQRFTSFAAARKSKFFVIKFFSVIFFAMISIITLWLFKNNYLGIQELGQYIYIWSNGYYVTIFLLLCIIFLFILNFRYTAFKLALPILPYITMLILLTKDAPWERLWTQIIVWNVILFSFLIDWVLYNDQKKYHLQRVWIGSLFLIVFILFYITPKSVNMVRNFEKGIHHYQNEMTYLRWVDIKLPQNAVILAGDKSELVMLGDAIEKPIIYNTLWSGAVFIKPEGIPDVSPSNWNITSELKKKDNFKEKRYFILEEDISLWKSRMADVQDNLFATNSATLLNPEMYTVKRYQSNEEIHKSIYELKLR